MYDLLAQPCPLHNSAMGVAKKRELAGPSAQGWPSPRRGETPGLPTPHSLCGAGFALDSGA